MHMNRVTLKQVGLAALMAVIAFNTSACLGKGKGKAPPPIEAPIVRKG